MVEKEPAQQATSTTDIAGIHPFSIVRYEDGYRVFGYKPTQLAEQIKLGAVPKPKYLGAPPSRAKGWTGDQIIQHYRDLEASQAEREAAAKKVYDEKLKPGRRKEAPPAPTAQPKVKKLKLRKPMKV